MNQPQSPRFFGALSGAMLLFIAILPALAAAQERPPIVAPPTAPPQSVVSSPSIALSKAEADDLAYEDALLLQVNATEDWPLLMKMSIITTLSQQAPQMSGVKIAETANSFEKKFRERYGVAQTGNTHALDLVSSIAEDSLAIVKDLVPPGAERAKILLAIASKAAKYTPQVYTALTSSQKQLEAQNDIAANIGGATEFQETIVRDFRAVQANANARQAATLTIQPVVGVAPEDGARKIFRTHPVLGTLAAAKDTNEQVKKISSDLATVYEALASNVGPDGSLTLKVDDIRSMARAEFSRMNASLEQVNASLGKLAKTQNAIAGFLVATRLQDAEQQRDAFRGEVEAQAQRSGVFLIATLLRNTDAKLAGQFQAVANTTLDIISDFNRFNNAVTTGVAAAGSIVLATNLVGAGLVLASMFANQGPSADEMIMKQLQQLFEAIDTMRKEMHERFDRVDAALNTIYHDMMIGFNNVYTLAEAINRNVVETKNLTNRAVIQLNTVDTRLAILGEKIDNLAADLFDEQTRIVVDECLQRRGVLGELLKTEEFSQCVLNFRRISTGIARSASLTNEAKVSLEQRMALVGELKKPTFANLGLLRQITNWPEYRTQNTAAYAQLSLANASYWAMGAQGFTALLIEYPEYAKNIPPATFSALLNTLSAPGEDVRAYLGALRDPDLIRRATDAYSESVTKLLSVESGVGRTWNIAVRETLEREIEGGDFNRPTNLPSLRDCGSGSWTVDGMPDLALNDAFFAALPSEQKRAYMLRMGALRPCYSISSLHGQLAEAEKECSKQKHTGPPREGDWECVEYRRTRDAACDWVYEIEAEVSATERLPLANVSATLLSAAATTLGAHASTPASKPDATRYNVNNFQEACGVVRVTPQVRDALAANKARFAAALKWQAMDGGAGIRDTTLTNIASREVELTTLVFDQFVDDMRNNLARSGKADATFLVALDEVEFRKAVLEAVLRAAYPHNMANSDSLRGNLHSAYGLLDANALITIFGTAEPHMIREWFGNPTLVPSKIAVVADGVSKFADCERAAIVATRQTSAAAWKDKEPREELRLVLSGDADREHNCVYRALSLYQESRLTPFVKYVLSKDRSSEEALQTGLVDRTLSELQMVRALYTP
jgi:hypothetical protein